jgi:hypothetical protein
VPMYRKPEGDNASFARHERTISQFWQQIYTPL